MRALFIVSSPAGFETLLSLASRIRDRGGRVILLFRGDGLRLLEDPYFEGGTSLAEEVYILGEGGRLRGATRPVGKIDFDGWKRLLEACEKVISWA